MWRGSGRVPFFSYEKGFGGEKIQRSPLFFRVCVTFPFQLLGRIRKAVLPLGGSAGCASALESSSGLRGQIFFTLPDACGLRPCDRTHLKNDLVPYSCVGGTHR